MSLSASLTQFLSQIFLLFIFLSPFPHPLVFLCFCWPLSAAACPAFYLSIFQCCYCQNHICFPDKSGSCLNQVMEKFKSFHRTSNPFSSWGSHIYSTADPDLEKVLGKGNQLVASLREIDAGGRERKICWVMRSTIMPMTFRWGCMMRKI